MIALRKSLRAKQLLVAIFALTMVCGVVSARALTPQDQQEIQSYKLTDDFLQKYGAAMAYARAHPSKDEETNNVAALQSIDTMTAEITKSPEKIAILKQHGLTPREAVVGGMVLLRARMADTMANDPKMAKYVDKSKIPSDANMAFYHAHKDEIVAMMKRDEQ